MGQITLPNNYFIDVDTRSYSLNKRYSEPRVDKKTGKTTIGQVIGYYSTLEAALNGFRRIYGRELIEDYEGEMTLDKALEILASADTYINNFFKAYNINNH